MNNDEKFEFYRDLKGIVLKNDFSQLEDYYNDKLRDREFAMEDPNMMFNLLYNIDGLFGFSIDDPADRDEEDDPISVHVDMNHKVAVINMGMIEPTPYIIDEDGLGSIIFYNRGYLMIGNERWYVHINRDKYNDTMMDISIDIQGDVSDKVLLQYVTKNYLG